MRHLFIFGLGYSALAIKRSLQARGWRVTATGSAGDIAFDDSEAVHRALSGATHVLSSVPPADGSDPVLDRYGEATRALRGTYLSSTGVYGDQKGAWVDESAPTGGGRRTARAQCDARWLDRGACVFRLPGIYGPGRSAFDRLADGRAHRIDLPGQIFSRVHVEDIASAITLALEQDAPPGAYNIADDLPASQNAVIEEACRLSGTPLPPLQTLDEAGLSQMARGFYAENRRVANGKARRVLGWRPAFPDYRSGLSNVWRCTGA